MTSIDVNVTQSVLVHHLQSITALDVDQIMSDFAEHAALFTANGVFHSPAQVRSFFVEALKLFTPEVLSQVKFACQEVNGEYAYIVWSAGPTIPFTSDTFNIRDGKIVMQSFAVQMGQ